MTVYDQIVNKKQKNKKQFAVLIDPDSYTVKELQELAVIIKANRVDYVFVGGSSLTNGNIQETVAVLKNNIEQPVVIFPGSFSQMAPEADALLLLSLISGRNPQYLIGEHVQYAHALQKSRLELIPTGYILIDSGKITSVAYVSNTTPMPADKPNLVAITALAGQQLGQKLIYLEAGSGADNSITNKIIETVKTTIHIPLIVGGGITNETLALEKYNAGADLIVVGNAIEKDPTLIEKISRIID